MSLIRGDALTIPLADDSVDLIVTSPPYFALRSYTDACGTCGGREAMQPTMSGGKESSTLAGKGPQHYFIEAVEADPDCPECEGSGRGHYAGQLGSEATPAAFIDALVSVTRECVRVLKPSGSLFVNLGDKYAGSGGNNNSGLAERDKYDPRSAAGVTNKSIHARISADGDGSSAGRNRKDTGIRAKSLMGLPWRYALRCIDDLGLILRAEIIWSKPNGLPESVQDRVRRSHEQWFHFTLEPRYYSAVDEIREPHDDKNRPNGPSGRDGVHAPGHIPQAKSDKDGLAREYFLRTHNDYNPLGKLPGSVWTVPTEPLRVPDDLPQHFAAFPSEWPRRIILGWSPSGICTECGEGRRPVVAKDEFEMKPFAAEQQNQMGRKWGQGDPSTRALGIPAADRNTTITGESCACPTPTAPTRPAVVLDPFCGTGTTPAVANALGRYGVGLDLSADYLRLARWRCNDPGLRAKALQVDKPASEVPGQMALL